MAPKYHKVPKFTGVYYYESQDQRHKGKPDCCFFIRYQDRYRRQQWEKVGWKSEGYSAQFASNVRNERIRDARHGMLPEGQKGVTFGDAWKQYDKWLNHGRKKPQDLRQLYRDHIKKDLENVPLEVISPQLLEQIKADTFAKGLSPGSVHLVLTLIRQVINKAIEWEMWSGANPVRKIKLPPLHSNRERFLAYAEAKALVDELHQRSFELWGMAIVSLETGMRAGEIMAMRWRDIDLNNGIINVRGKGGYDRQAFITEPVLLVLNGRDKSKSEFVFHQQDGSKLNSITITFNRAAEHLGLNKKDMDRKQLVSFHTLRHTFASWLAINGVPLYTIKELMGHKSIKMTERYAHLCPDHKRDAVLRVSGLWSAAYTDQEKHQDPVGGIESGDQP